MRPSRAVTARIPAPFGAPLRRIVGGILHATGRTRPGRAGRGRLTIATFHRVLPDELVRDYPLPHLAVTVRAFEWFIAFFARHYTCGPVGALHARWTAGERPERPFLALTFDDGQLDNQRFAVPVLARSGLGASFFVPVAAIDVNEPLWHDRLGYAALRLLRADRARGAAVLGIPAPGRDAGDLALVHAAVQRAKRLSPADRLREMDRVEAAAGGPSRPAWDGMMGWDDLRAMSRSGHEIGSHSWSHPILPDLDDAALEVEISGSRRRIEEELGAPCPVFCYPNGSLDDRVASSVARAGYRLAVTTAHGRNVPGQDPYRLTRIELQGRHAGSDAMASLQLSGLRARLRA